MRTDCEDGTLRGLRPSQARAHEQREQKRPDDFLLVFGHGEIMLAAPLKRYL
jgi:hypothetical protein